MGEIALTVDEIKSAVDEVKAAADKVGLTTLFVDVSEDEYRNALSDLSEERYDDAEPWRQSFFVKIMSMIDANEAIYFFMDGDALPPEVHAFARRRIFADFVRGFDDLVTRVGSDENMRDIMAEAESRFEGFSLE